MYTLNSRADVVTERPGRWAKQLVSHLSNKVSHEKTERGDELAIGDGLGVVIVESGSIVLEAHADSAEDLARVEDVLGRHLERFAEKDGLKVTWSR
ncbi:MAG: DUF2218 domain-containing protein [Salinibacterium sp.]|nr:DUF2218 domain-containing protein [Salinibacterium sp.]